MKIQLIKMCWLQRKQCLEGNGYVRKEEPLICVPTVKNQTKKNKLNLKQKKRIRIKAEKSMKLRIGCQQKKISDIKIGFV